MKSIEPITILIADDDQDDRDFLRFLFTNHEAFELVGCLENGQQVIDVMQGGSKLPDVLVTDFYMPGLNGSDLIDSLQKSNVLDQTFVFVISTTINDLEKEKFIGHPNIKFLLKPANLTEINDFPELLLEKLNKSNVNRI